MSQMPIADIRQTTAMGIAPSFAGQTKEEAPPILPTYCLSGIPDFEGQQDVAGQTAPLSVA